MVKTSWQYRTKLATNVLKTASKRVIERTTEATGDLVENPVAKKITKAALENTCEALRESAAPA